MRKVLRWLGFATIIFAVLLVARTVSYRSIEPPVETVPIVSVGESAPERLAGAIRIPTISHDDPAKFDGAAFQELHAHLHSAFPLVHSRLQREIVGNYSLLYTWRGTNPARKPILLVGHMDVVPVEPGTERKWQEDPFGGRILDGFVWGRGAIDNKSTVVGTLEAVETLLRADYQPARTVLLAYGHDEEVGGAGGAREIAGLLKQRGVEIELVLDEGGVITDGVLQGVTSPVALVGIAEKGFATVELSTRSSGGHSSLPPRQTAIGMLSVAIGRLEQNQMPARLEGPTRLLFDRVGPRFPFAQRAVFANLWLTKPLVLRNLEGSPVTNAMVRTTTAPTIFQAGTKDNVLASQARAVVNFRIAPGDSITHVLEHVKRVIDDDRIEVKLAGSFSAEPSAVSHTESPTFQAMERTIRSTNPDAIVAPYLVLVATDARHYAGLTPNVYRFLPLRLKAEDIERMHGTNERVSIEQYLSAIRLYRQLIVNTAGS